MQITVVIATHNRPALLREAIASIEAQSFREWEIVVVDDGSGPDFATTFALVGLAGATVLTHETNRGKGFALRTGFEHVRDHHPGRAVICADCDGQHTIEALLAVADRLADDPHQRSIVLGTRQFTGRVPFRSRLGNDVTRVIFRAVTGHRVQDTQTGLRAYPAALLEWLLTIDGDRFEYELVVLLRACREGVDLIEVPIETVYLDENASSHFRPVIDSWRIYRPLLAHALRSALRLRGVGGQGRPGQQGRYLASSLAGFCLDLAVVLLVQASVGSLVAAVVVARLVSGTVNFSLNRWWVFRAAGGSLGRSVRRYVAVAVVVLAGNVVLVSALVGLGLAVAVAKVVTEVSLFVVGYVAQRLWVFSRGVLRHDPARREHERVTVGS